MSTESEILEEEDFQKAPQTMNNGSNDELPSNSQSLINVKEGISNLSVNVEARTTEGNFENGKKVMSEEDKEVTRDDLFKIIEETHRILSEEIMSLKNDLNQKLQAVKMSKQESQLVSDVDENVKNTDKVQEKSS